MRKEQEINLMLCKWTSSKKENQTVLMEHILEYISFGAETVEHMINVLDGKSIRDKQTGIAVGDKFFIDLAHFSSYPKIKKEYYKNNNLLINNSIIEVECVKYNLFNNTIQINAFTDLTIESVLDVSPSYVIHKIDLNIM